LPPDETVGLHEALDAYLRRSGLKRRLDQASVVDEWAALVGPQIASVTTPEGVAENGVLFVRVATAPWMQELQLMSPDILRRLGKHGKKITRIAWRVGDPGEPRPGAARPDGPGARATNEGP
jgi:predicted nucleic acid-binding Zn ribbon protein